MKRKPIAKYLFAVLFAVFAAAVLLPAQNAQAAGIDNIRARAQQLCDIEWTPLKNVPVHTYTPEEPDWYYEAGLTYHGIPYGQVPGEGFYVTFEATLDEFLAAVADPDSDFYTKRAAYGNQRSPWYAMDCSAYVSYCLGSPRYPTSSIGKLTYNAWEATPEQLAKKEAFGWLADIPEDVPFDAEEYDHFWEMLVEPGDCLNIPGYHVALILDVERDKKGQLLRVTVTETMEPVPDIYELELPDFARRFAGYELIRYNGKDDVPPPVKYTPIDTRLGKGWPKAVFNEPKRPGANAMYRLYYPATHEHLYTADRYEAQTLCTKERGWYFEGVAWYAPKTGDPVYRLFNPATTDHHYTMDLYEYETLGRSGWNMEGIGWYSDPAKGMAMHRLFTRELTVGAHHYTSDEYEYEQLMKAGVWADEGIGWYGLK